MSLKANKLDDGLQRAASRYYPAILIVKLVSIYRTQFQQLARVHFRANERVILDSRHPEYFT